MLSLYSYTRQNRLLTPKDFQHVFNAPIKYRAPYFILFVRRNEGLGARLGVVITKRRFKHAVVRNRIRRLIRESFRHYSPELCDIDIIVLAKEQMKSQTNAYLYRELNQHWQKLILAPSSKSRYAD